MGKWWMLSTLPILVCATTCAFTTIRPTNKKVGTIRRTFRLHQAFFHHDDENDEIEEYEDVDNIGYTASSNSMGASSSYMNSLSSPSSSTPSAFDWAHSKYEDEDETTRGSYLDSLSDHQKLEMEQNFQNQQENLQNLNTSPYEPTPPPQDTETPVTRAVSSYLDSIWTSEKRVQLQGDLHPTPPASFTPNIPPPDGNVNEQMKSVGAHWASASAYVRGGLAGNSFSSSSSQNQNHQHHHFHQPTMGSSSSMTSGEFWREEKITAIGMPDTALMMNMGDGDDENEDNEELMKWGDDGGNDDVITATKTDSHTVNPEEYVESLNEAVQNFKAEEEKVQQEFDDAYHQTPFPPVPPEEELLPPSIPIDFLSQEEEQDIADAIKSVDADENDIESTFSLEQDEEVTVNKKEQLIPTPPDTPPPYPAPALEVYGEEKQVEQEEDASFQIQQDEEEEQVINEPVVMPEEEPTLAKEEEFILQDFEEKVEEPTLAAEEEFTFQEEPPPPPPQQQQEEEKPDQSISQNLASTAQSTLGSKRIGSYITAREKLRDTQYRTQKRWSRMSHEKQRAADKIARLQRAMEREKAKVEMELKKKMEEAQVKIDEEVQRVSDLLGHSIKEEVQRTNQFQELLNNLQYTISTKESEMKNEATITSEMASVRSKIKSGPVAKQLDALLEQRMQYNTLETDFIEDLNSCKNEMEALLRNSQEMSGKMNDVLERIVSLDVTQADENYEWSDVDLMEDVLDKAAVNVARSDERVMTLKAKLDRALVKKSQLLEEPIPDALKDVAKKVQEEEAMRKELNDGGNDDTPLLMAGSDGQSAVAAGQLTVLESDPTPHQAKGVPKISELKSKSSREIFGVLGMSMAKASVDGSKAAIFGVKALLDGITSEQVAQASGEAFQKSRNVVKGLADMEEVVDSPEDIAKLGSDAAEVTEEVIGSFGKAGKAFVSNIKKTESAKETGSAFREASHDLMSAANALVALGVQGFMGMRKKIEEANAEVERFEWERED